MGNFMHWSNTMLKEIFVVLLVLATIHAATVNEKDCCEECEDYFITNCPIKRGDYNGCCLCTQYYYYGCDCCREVVEEIGVLGDCTKWGEPTGHDQFCISNLPKSEKISEKLVV